MPRLLVAMAILALCAGSATARTLVDAGVVGVEADMTAQPRCTIGLDAQLCVATWEMNDTLLPGDDYIMVNKDVTDVTVIVRPPLDPGLPSWSSPTARAPRTTSRPPLRRRGAR